MQKPDRFRLKQYKILAFLLYTPIAPWLERVGDGEMMIHVGGLAQEFRVRHKAIYDCLYWLQGQGLLLLVFGDRRRGYVRAQLTFPNAAWVGGPADGQWQGQDGKQEDERAEWYRVKYLRGRGKGPLGSGREGFDVYAVDRPTTAKDSILEPLHPWTPAERPQHLPDGSAATGTSS